MLSSKINLVDLAGSERADLTADSGRLQEGAAINKSLSALGNVINALTEGHDKGGTPSKGAAAHGGTPASSGKGTARKGAQGTPAGPAGAAAASHVPYRSSKLTRLLEESLGGNTVTVMLAAISADPRHARETLSTLKCAAKAPSN